MLFIIIFGTLSFPINTSRDRVVGSTLSGRSVQFVCCQQAFRVAVQGLEFRIRLGLGSAKVGGSVAEWLACWTQAQKGLGSNRSRDAVQ